MHRSIIVTTPKSEIENSKLEAEACLCNGGGYYFRTISKEPKDIEPFKSFIYYVDDGYIRGRATIIGITGGSEKCQETNREWGNNKSKIIWMQANTWEWIDPIPMKGFQGWRYFDDKCVKVVGGWRDEKPSTYN